jgi:hypothetical protein
VPSPPAAGFPFDGGLYVPRREDAELDAAILRRDSIVRLGGARHMGKTAVLTRALQQAAETGARVVLTDLRALSAAHLASAEAFFLALARHLTRELHLDVEPEATWDSLQGPNRNFREFVLRVVLDRINAPLVWGLDGADRLFGYAFSTEVFGLLRTWHNERALNPALPWSRLTVVLTHSTEAHLFIRDPNQSPFNVGTRITLHDFDAEQTQELNRRLGEPLPSTEAVSRFHDLMAGQPSLTDRGLRAIAREPLSLAELLVRAARDDGPFADHLQRVLTIVARDPDHLQVVRALRQGRPCSNAGVFHRLWSAGVLAGATPQNARLRCPLYEGYLRRHLT